MTPQTFRIDVWEVRKNPLINKWVSTAHHLGTDSLTDCFTVRVFFVQGTLSALDAERIAQTLLADPVTERYTISAAEGCRTTHDGDHYVEVSFLPGVTDSVAENLLRACRRLGLTGVVQAATGTRYVLSGSLSAEALQFLAAKMFSNIVIQHFAIDQPIAPGFVSDQTADDLVETVALCESDDEALLRISQERRLALSLDEMRAVQAYFRAEEREPSDVEIETIAQTWSEHCVHKTFRARIHYTGPLPGTEAKGAPVAQEIDGILKTYLRAATDQLDKDWIRSAFVDNAGIIKFNDELDLAFKVETHNHPSAIEPFGGANTGVGGVIRDVLGVSARPIANTDVLCFGLPDMAPDQVPGGTIHPALIADGVVHGIEDYGNKMGIPTVNGAVLYHPSYTANPLVFCGCLGVLPHNSHPSDPQPGDFIIVIGGRTGRDGLRGATFSSMEMDATTGEIAGSSVQIGHPINEKQVQEVILRARDAGLYHAITDCGAGGLSSAVGEMAETHGRGRPVGAVPLKYEGLRPWEIWLSEAQERMVLAVRRTTGPRFRLFVQPGCRSGLYRLL